MQFKTLFLAAFMAMGAIALPNPEPQDDTLTPADITPVTPDIIAPDRQPKNCGGGGFPPRKAGSGCGSNTGIFTCSKDCQKVLTCNPNNDKWEIVGRCNGPTNCRYASANDPVCR